jgi:hypothetical protein
MFRTYCVAVRLPNDGIVMRSDGSLRNTFSDLPSESSTSKRLLPRHSHFVNSFADWQAGLLGLGTRPASFLKAALVSAYARTSPDLGPIFRRPG